jgi:hypothetical protein
MGHDEDKNFNALNELNRISSAQNQNDAPMVQSLPNDDIVIKGQKDNKKIIIIGAIIALVLVLIVAIIIFVNIGSKSGDKGEKPSPEISKSSFNQFYHYLTEAKDDDSDVTLKEVEKKTPYLQKNKVSNINEYLKKLDEKYFAFINEYSKTSGKNLPSDLYAFCYGYYKVNNDIKNLELVSLYKDEGIDAAKNEMFETIKPIGDPQKTNSYLDKYIILQRKILEAEISELALYDESGCIAKDKIIDGCYPTNKEVFAGYEQTIESSIDSLVQVEYQMSNAARNELKTLYKEVYSIKDNGVVINE